MFNVYPDILKKISITNCYITSQKKVYWAKILAISTTEWIIVLDVFLETSDVIFHVEYEHEYFHFSVSCELHKGEMYTHTYTVHFSSSIPEKLLKKIIHIDETMGYLDKRKETRFSVGIAHSEKFGLIQQYLFIEKNRYPCSIRDVSVHGLSLYSHPYQRKIIEKIVTLRLELKNPSESILMQGIPIRIEMKAPEICLYSLYFHDPVPIQYKMRVAEYAKLFT
jgi:hypothetical protein